MYLYGALAILLNLGTIFYFVICKRVFSPMTSKKWIIIFCTIVFGFLFFDFLGSRGLHDPWLYPEELSNLTKQEGNLRLTHFAKGNSYYLEIEERVAYPLKFVYPSPMTRFVKYEDEYVTIWKKGRYVYQMEIEGDVVFPISKANDEIFLFNCIGVMGDMMWLWWILSVMFRAML